MTFGPNFNTFPPNLGGNNPTNRRSNEPTIFRRRSCEKVAPAGSLKRTAAFL
jgi:hypothetical protein